MVAVVAALAAAACDEPKPQGPAPSRFNAPTKSQAAGSATSTAASAFCEKQWPAGEGGKAFAAPPERPIEGVTAAAARPGVWRWINLWATWCHPCVEEMGLLTRWRDSLAKDGVAVDFEMWSVDDDGAALAAWLKKTKTPGAPHWVRSLDDLPAVLESLGADKASAIPVHALVDGNGKLRCLRVGQVHDEDYAAIKAMLSGA